MSEQSNPEWLRRFGQEDLAASFLRVGLAAAGPLGAVIAEFATQLVPAQRLGRLQDYVEQLGERFVGLEQTFQERLKSSAGHSALAEEASLAAVRSASSERRRDLAALLRNGFEVEEADLVNQVMLLRLLESLNDVEVVLLTYYKILERATFSDPALEVFRDQHPGVFSGFPGPPTLADSADEHRRWEIHVHYLHQLERRGLLRETEGMVKSSSRPKMVITELGKMLLAAIDRADVKATTA